MLPTIYKKTKGNKIQEWTVEVNGNSYRTISGQTDGLKVTSEYTICFAKNVGKANETTSEEQAQKEAEALFKKKIEGGYHESIGDIENKKFFEPMLAEKWEDYEDVIKYPVYSQPKLDGIRCIVKSDGMWTRSGKKLVSAPHIHAALKPFFDLDPSLIFDGELYNHSLKDNFNKIVSLSKKTKPTKEDLEESSKTIQYYIYDLPSAVGQFLDRSKALLDIQYHKTIMLPDCIQFVPTHPVINKEAIYSLYEEYIQEGYEGQMIRLNRPYQNKRTKFLLKHKSFNDLEFKILDIVEGEGNRTGTAGHMVFEINGQRFKSNIKGEFEYVQSVWNDRHNLIGKMATVTYFNLTPAGIPRFPYVTNINREEYE